MKPTAMGAVASLLGARSKVIPDANSQSEGGDMPTRLGAARVGGRLGNQLLNVLSCVEVSQACLQFTAEQTDLQSQVTDPVHHRV